MMLSHFILPIYISAILGIVSRSVEADGCEDKWVLEKDHCYYFSADSKSWDAAKVYCQSLDANLVKIESEQENAFLTKNMQGTNTDYWIGLYEKYATNWFWISDDTLLSSSSYINWKEGEPNNYDPSGEDCGSFFRRTPGYWNDLSCSSIVHYICEGSQQKDVEYRIRMKAAQNRSSEYVVLDGNSNEEVRIQLNTMVFKYDGLRVSEVTSRNIGTVTGIQYESDAALHDTKNPEFVSIHKSDNDGFYIKRFDKGNYIDDQTHKPCVRHFGKALKLIMSGSTGLETVPFKEVKDEIDCKLRCIESDTFDCRVAYYSTSYRACQIIKQDDIKDHFSDTDREDVFVFKRTDNC